MVRDIVLSGFQLELYTDEEKTFAYWYSVRIIDEHLRRLDNLLDVAPDGLYLFCWNVKRSTHTILRTYRLRSADRVALSVEISYGPSVNLYFFVRGSYHSSSSHYILN